MRREGPAGPGAGVLCAAGGGVAWSEGKFESLELKLRALRRMDARWSWAGGRLRCLQGPLQCPGSGAAARAGTELGRPHAPGGPARPAPAAKLKGGRGLCSPLPIAPPRAPGRAQAQARPAHLRAARVTTRGLFREGGVGGASQL